MCTGWGRQEIRTEILFGSFQQNNLLKRSAGEQMTVVKTNLRYVGWKYAK